MRIRRSTLLGTAIACALHGPGLPAHADPNPAEASPGSAGDTMLGEVVVTGIRASVQQSLETKRDAQGVVDAISAEDVGKFPDKNLAEALQRVPGIVINREFGEGERVSLRGTAPNLTRTLLNGHGLATADWFILDQLSTTRSFNYLMLPSDIIGQVVVHKTPQADLDEGGIGGTIDVITRKPLGLDANAFYASAQMAYTDLADESEPQGTALYSWKNADETFGVLAAAIYQKRTIRRDGVEVLGYFPVDVDPTAAVNEVQVPSLIGSALFQQERVRKGGNLAFQWKPTDATEINLSGLYSKFDADNVNENFLAWGVRAIGNGGTLTNSTIAGNTAVAGRISSLNGGTGDFGVVYDAIDRQATADTNNVDLDARWDVNESWTLHFRGGYTHANGDTEAQPFVEFGAPAVFDYDLRGRAPQVSYQNVDPTDPADLQFIFSSLHQILNEDSETYAYADAETKLDAGWLKSLKFGAKHTHHDRELVFNATTYGGFHVPINTTPSTAFAGGPTPGDFLDAIASPGTLRSYWQIDRGAVQELLFANLANGSGRVPYPQQNFSVTEKATAGYLMGNLGGERWSGNVGVRYVRTEQVSRGALVSPSGSIQNPFGNYDPLRVERTYNDWLPSLNLSFDLREDVKLRFAVARVMARPDYTDIAPRASLNPGALTGTSGNPDLDPYRANQADLSLEWYPDRDTLLAAALYYKDIKSFITDRPVTQFFNVQSQSAPSTACTVAGTNLFSCPFLINQRSNGGGGKIQGAELSLVRPIWGGIGVQANYTYSDGEADNGDPLPGNSKNTYNASVYFENDVLSARLAYTYRSDFFVTFDRSTPLNQEALKSLDASFAWNVTDMFAVTAEAVNLTNEKIVQYAGDRTRPRAIYDNGRIYFAGVRVRL